MERFHVWLRPEQKRLLRQAARRHGMSVAALVREAVDRAYGSDDDRARAWDRALESIGGFRSGRSDISENHDDYLAEAFGR